MNNIEIFDNQEFGQVRVVMIDGEPNFVAKDVCDALGYKRTYAAVRRLDEDEKGTQSIRTPGGKQEMTIINESGLYNLILGSKKKRAKKFKRWVTHEVLPSIRKHGMYAEDEILDNPDLLIEVATKLKQERAERKKLETQVNKLKPKADYTDKILRNKGLVTITQIAKDYGMSGKGMNKLLHELEIQYKQTNQWLLYSKYQGEGYTQSETFTFTRSSGNDCVRMITKWTQKGRMFLYKSLKKNGILPSIEQESGVA